jgi:hypothetical protein
MCSLVLLLVHSSLVVAKYSFVKHAVVLHAENEEQTSSCGASVGLHVWKHHRCSFLTTDADRLALCLGLIMCVASLLSTTLVCRQSRGAVTWGTT